MGVEKEIIKRRGKLLHFTALVMGKTTISTRDYVHKPVTFIIGQGHVIKGWDEGVLEMQIGEVARLKCSPDYAFGANGFPEWGILPNSHLVFEMQLLYAE